MNVIVGVDPGTTVAWCVLDLNGNVVKIDSEKEVSLDSLISKLRNLTPIAVGCDKAKVPGFVSDFATKFHAKIFAPKQDLSIIGKRESTKKYDFKNTHEMDALASALLAYRRLSNILSRIKSYLYNKDKTDLFECVADLVIRDDLTIHASLSICSPVEKVTDSLIEKEESSDKDYAKLYGLLKSARKENSFLHNLNDSLVSEIGNLRSKINLIQEKMLTLVKPKPVSSMLNEKEARLKILTNRLNSQNKLIKKLRKDNQFLQTSMLSPNHIAIPKVARLSGEKPSERIFFVHNPNEFSESFLKSLPKDTVIVVNKTPGMKARRLLPSCIDSRGMIIKEFENIVILNKTELNRRRASSSLLKQVVQKYKASRIGSV